MFAGFSLAYQVENITSAICQRQVRYLFLFPNLCRYFDFPLLAAGRRRTRIWSVASDTSPAAHSKVRRRRASAGCAARACALPLLLSRP